MAHTRIRTFNKHVTNPFFRLFAKAPYGPVAVLYHRGRRSGKPYETPLMVWRLGAGFVIALLYGDSVDWYRNILATDQSTLLWHGRLYTVGKPTPMENTIALAAFPLALRPIAGNRVQQFVYLRQMYQPGEQL